MDEGQGELEVDSVGDVLGQVAEDGDQLIHTLSVLDILLFQPEPGGDVVLDGILERVEPDSDRLDVQADQGWKIRTQEGSAFSGQHLYYTEIIVVLCTIN